MPVRIEKDQPDPRKRNDNIQPQPDPQPRRRGRIPLIGLLLGFFTVLAKPKLFIPVILILAAVYFFGGGLFGDEQNVPFEYEAETDEFSFGAELSEEEYDKAFVSEPLAVGASGLPSRASIEEYAPRIMHQGRQGSCSGWASAYGARTISYARANGVNPNEVAFSPSFLYNQIALERCQGAYLRDAMQAMQQIGSLPFSQFKYTDRTCQIMPDRAEVGSASQYRIKGYNRLTEGVTNYTPDMYGIKQHLAQGAPVIIGMMVGQSFQRGMIGKQLWTPTRNEYNGYGLGGHAMCVVGYDDDVAGGSFRLMNSWGGQWGENGFAWVRYSDFNSFVKEAYGIFPEGKEKKFDKNRLEVQFALVESETQKVIPLTQTEEIVFRTSQPVRKGSKFKVAVTNSVECYTYIFGKETDGSSYVLFPYTPKHSAYCGITGTRLFPRDYSLTPDQIGNRDQIAIVVSKKPLDFERVNANINQSGESTYMMRMVSALINDFVPECDFEVNESVYFNCNTKDKDVLGMIIELDKY